MDAYPRDHETHGEARHDHDVLSGTSVLMLMIDGNTKLYLIEPSPTGFKPLASAVVQAGDNWPPLALVDGKLLVCGQKELKVLQVAQ